MTELVIVQTPAGVSPNGLRVSLAEESVSARRKIFHCSCGNETTDKPVGLSRKLVDYAAPEDEGGLYCSYQCPHFKAANKRAEGRRKLGQHIRQVLPAVEVAEKPVVTTKTLMDLDRQSKAPRRRKLTRSEIRERGRKRSGKFKKGGKQKKGGK